MVACATVRNLAYHAAQLLHGMNHPEARTCMPESSSRVCTLTCGRMPGGSSSSALTCGSFKPTITRGWSCIGSSCRPRQLCCPAISTGEHAHIRPLHICDHHCHLPLRSNHLSCILSNNPAAQTIKGHCNQTIALFLTGHYAAGAARHC
jgi:hypothetical protein